MGTESEPNAGVSIDLTCGPGAKGKSAVKICLHCESLLSYHSPNKRVKILHSCNKSTERLLFILLSHINEALK